VDSDLIEAVDKLKAVLDKRSGSYCFGTVPKNVVAEASQRLGLPFRYRSFLTEANPVELQTVTPVESIQFIPAEELLQEQVGFSLGEDLKPVPAGQRGSWRKEWVVIAYGVLGDPYFLDTSAGDAEGDCPVYTAMSGTERWDPTLAASSIVQFLQVLAAAMEVAEGFGEADVGVDDEDVFREALGPKIRPIDPAALRAGHWT